MIIDPNKTYRIAFQEDADCTTGLQIVMNDTLHNPPYLEFTGGELIEAICIMGLLPHEVNNRTVALKRMEELNFKIHMVQAIIKEKKDKAGNDCLSINEETAKYLDSSEKSAISYWLGMFFSTLLAKHEYGFKYVIHYSRFEQSSYCSKKIGKRAYTDPNTQRVINLSTPDLIAMDGTKYQYGVFEAKGNKSFDKLTMNKAMLQAQQVRSINGRKKIIKLVSYTRIRNTGIIIRTKDPVGGDLDIFFNRYQAFLWQYLPIAELFYELQNDNKVKSEDGYYVCKDLFVGNSCMCFDSFICNYLCEILQSAPDKIDNKLNLLITEDPMRGKVIKHIRTSMKDNRDMFMIE